MKFFYCKKCLMPSTRPRNTFNEEGVCNGCTWAEQKKTFDWADRATELDQICDIYRGDGKDWDMIIPWSGGKDSYHIAYQMKEKFGMHPLLVKVAPLLPTDIGRCNEENIRDQGFDLIKIHPSGIYVDLCKQGMIEQGRPQLGFVTGITTALVKMAMGLGIKWLMYGEEGETEYGGSTGYATHGFNRDWIVDIYFSGHDVSKRGANSPWWDFPSQEVLDSLGIKFSHWSHFTPWDSMIHLTTALGMGFERRPEFDDGVTGVGTFTDFTSLDDPYMRTLHTYFMFLKFGFGRGSHEATGEIRAGRMTRDKGISIASMYDSYDCRHFLSNILDLFRMSEEEFYQVVDKHANRALLENEYFHSWSLKPSLHHGIFIDNAVEIDYDGSY